MDTILEDLYRLEEELENFNDIYYIENYLFDPNKLEYLFLAVNNEEEAINFFKKYVEKNNCLNASLSFKGKEDSTVILDLCNGHFKEYIKQDEDLTEEELNENGWDLI